MIRQVYLFRKWGGKWTNWRAVH